jgi:hypothetical protein
MRRREFIVGIGSAAAWPLATLAQQGEPVPDIRRGQAGDKQEGDRNRSSLAQNSELVHGAKIKLSGDLTHRLDGLWGTVQPLSSVSRSRGRHRMGPGSWEAPT